MTEIVEKLLCRLSRQDTKGRALLVLESIVTNLNVLKGLMVVVIFLVVSVMVTVVDAIVDVVVVVIGDTFVVVIVDDALVDVGVIVVFTLSIVDNDDVVDNLTCV